MDGGYPGRPEPAFEREIEVRRVDPDEYVRSGGFEAPRETMPLRYELDEAPDRLEEAHDRKALHREEGIEAERLHLRASDPAETGPGLGGADGAHEPCPEQVARHLAGDHRDGGARSPSPLADDPATGGGEELDEGRHLRTLFPHLLQTFQGLGHRRPFR